MLELRGIAKSFGGIHALKGVDLFVKAGEVLGLVGGNGAGKSTLMKIAAGIHRPDRGVVSIDGHSPATPADAIARGVSLVRQELIQAEALDVGSNVMLGHEPQRFGVVDSRSLYRAAKSALDRVGAELDPRKPLRECSPAARQRVEIARALSLNAKILLLDEPTAALAERDARALFDLLRELKANGIGMVYVSHRLREVLEITDRIVCLRDGQRVREIATHEASHEQLVQLLAGDAPGLHDEPPPHGERVVMSVKGRVEFELREGEVLGLAGLVGAGRTRVMRELFGLNEPRSAQERLRVAIEGRPVRLRGPREAISAGIMLVPEERASQGLILEMLVERNVALPSLSRFWLENELEIARPLMERFGIRSSVEAWTLSGGNQQKAVLAKWMLKNPKVLLLDEPTRGLDVRAKRDVYAVVRELAARGKGIIVSSSEAEELSELCHRSLVLRMGKSMGELDRGQMSDANVLRLGS